MDCKVELVDEQRAKQALKDFQERIAKGEDPKEITGIKDTYYLNKLIKGLLPITVDMYLKMIKKEV